MSSKKWFAVFIISLFATAGIWALFNFLVDPFGLFADPLLSYSEYSMTENPRVAKIGYLDKNHEKYDSYIIGCSKSSSIPTEALNKYYNASFYNMIMYGGDLYDIEKTAEYVIDNYGAKNIVVAIGLEEANAFNTEADPIKGNLHAKVDNSSVVPFYFKYLFLNPEYIENKLRAYLNRSYLISPSEVFIAETGTYNKSRRDAAQIPKLDKYLKENPEFTWGSGKYKMEDADLCVESLARIKAKCQENGVNLTVIACPIYENELKLYDREQVISYYKKIAEKVDFWNFSGYTVVSSEPRYFYDSLHFRNCVGDMMLARMFSDDSVFVPEKFGEYITSENADEALARLFEPVEKEEIVKKLPILMYHHFTPEHTETDAVSAARLDEHLTALENAGYTVVGLDDIMSYTTKGTPLPEKPVLITIDDGYSSVLDVAAPVFEKHNAQATVAVIGGLIGHSTYKDTDLPITKHFSLEEALPYVQNGTYTIISHTWDMHQVQTYDGVDCRHGVLQQESESEEDYLSALEADHGKVCEAIESAFGTPLRAVAYPYGVYSETSEVYLSQNGIDITFTTNWSSNEIVKGIPQTLRLLSRYSVDESVSGDLLVDILERG